MSKLITTSLIGSIDWFKNCPSSWKERAYKDLKNMLDRVWSTPGKAAQRGIDFEKHVYRILGNVEYDKTQILNLKCSDNFKIVLDLCIGGKFQQKNKSFITVDGIEYCLYGKEDVTFDECIFDIKTTSNFKESKYLKSFQHKIYLHNTKKKHFIYIVVIFPDVDSNEIQEIKYIEIVIDNLQLAEYKIDIINKIKEIKEFFDGMPELCKLYNTKYCRY